MPRILLALLAGLVVVGVVFAVWPDLDLAVARSFLRPGGFVGDSPIERLVRDFFRVTPFVVLAFTALYLARRFGFAVRWAPNGRAAFFLVATMTIGPA